MIFIAAIERVTFRSLLFAKQFCEFHSQAHRFVYSNHRLSGFFIKMSDDGSESWRGAPITHIYGAETPWGAPEFPLVRPASNHTVLYHVESDGTIRDRPPKPQIGKDVWDQYHVRLPCSSHSLYPVQDESGETRLKKRWGLIKNALSKPIRNSHELADAILSYNTKFKDKWRFTVLHKLFNKYLEKDEMRYFFDVTLPEIVKLALDLPNLIQSPIPLLKQHKNHSISLSQQQIASLLANAFFCTFPRRNSSKRESEYSSYPSINFSRLYESSASRYALEKVKCICNYFRRVCSTVPTGVVTFSRRSVPPKKCPDWSSSTKLISSIPVHADSEVFIEHADGLIQVDFANRFLGGGVLGHGCVQEEIRFIICPELIASMIFTEEMRPNEAVMIIGVEQYSEYTGYGNDFEWAGDYRDKSPVDASARKRCCVLAIDALSYSRNVQAQYEHDKIDRELNKAWVGFSFYTGDESELSYPGVATGNWGCGVYRGSPYLKSLLQIMACTEASRPMAYYTFQDTELRDDIVNMYEVLARYGVSVGQLYKHILNYCKGMRSQDLHTYLQHVLKQTNEPSDSEPMDISATSDVQDVSKTTEVKNHDNRSPDLFSPDDSDYSQIKAHFFTQSTSHAHKNSQNSQDCQKTITENQHSNENIVESQKLHIPESHISDESITDNKNDDKPSCNQNNQPNNAENVPEASHTSRLFEEMEKIDESSGKLNFTTPNTSLFDANTSFNQSLTDNESKIQMDLSTETKKKLTGKITDYFQKKLI